MNVLALRCNAVEFIGFDNLDADGLVSVRILAGKLVINLGRILTAAGKIDVRLHEKKSGDRNLCDLFRYYCGGKPTVFISSKPDRTEYIQSFQLTEEELRDLSCSL